MSKISKQLDHCCTGVVNDWMKVMADRDKMSTNKTKDNLMYDCCMPYDTYDCYHDAVQANCDKTDLDKLVADLTSSQKANIKCKEIPYKGPECRDFKHPTPVGTTTRLTPAGIVDQIKLDLTANVSKECGNALHYENMACVDDMREYYSFLMSGNDPQTDDTLVVIRCCLTWDLVDCMDEVAKLLLIKCNDKDYKSMHVCLESNSRSICPEFDYSPNECQLSPTESTTNH
ncbi:unnamed protein product, partial [Medioppia subpectinata]